MKKLLLLLLLPGLLGACSSSDVPAANRDADPGTDDGGLPEDAAETGEDGGRPSGDAGAPPADSGTGLSDGGPEPEDAGRGDPDTNSPDSGAGCAEPTPFVAPGAPAGWRHESTRLFTVTQGAANHRAQDVIVQEGEPQLIVGKFAYGVFDKDLKDEEVEVFIQERPPCGGWTSLGVQLTSEEGQYGDQYGIADDGGRIFFPLPAEQARPVGRYPLRLLVRGDESQAALTLTVLPAATSTVVFDIDGTLTTADFELITELFTELFAGEYVPEMRDGAPEIVWRWASKGYLVVYLTGRPDFLHRQSLDWLVAKGFPPGPLHLTDTTGQALPSAGGVGTYKTEFLSKIKDEGGVFLDAAYGNATTDIQAYAAAGIPLESTFIIGDHGGEGGTVGLVGYPEHLAEAQAMPAATVAAPAAVGW